MNPLTVSPAVAIARLRERTREQDARRCSVRGDRAIHAARSARTALERAGG